MKSWFHDPESDTRLILKDVPIPDPGSGEILVQVRAAALNRGEFLPKTNRIAGQKSQAAGIECAGEIVKLGPGVNNLSFGDPVMGRAKMAFSEYALLRTGDVSSKPDLYSWEEAAAASITYQVSYEMLWWHEKLRQNDWLLVTGVSSGVGVAAFQLGKYLKANVIGTSRSKEKLDQLSNLGLDLGVSGYGPDFVDAVLQITAQKGVNLVVNNVGGSVFGACQMVLAYQGRVATVGHLDGHVSASFDVHLQHAKRQCFFGVSNKMRSADEVAATVNGYRQEVLPAMCAGEIRPAISECYSFRELPEAVSFMKTDRQLGKIIISIP